MLNVRHAAAVAVVALATVAPLSGAAPIIFTTALSGAAENPSNVSPGTGAATVILDPDADTLQVIVSFSGLLGLTTVSHIHCCAAPPNNVGVATQLPTFSGFPVNVSSGTYDNTFNTALASTWNPAFVTNNGGTPASAEAALLAGLFAGTAYLNVHSSAFPGGEIRGFLVQRVPEPGTLLLVGIGLTALALPLRRRRAPAHR